MGKKPTRSAKTKSGSAGAGSLGELLKLLELIRPVDPPKKPTKSLLAAVFADDVELVKRFLDAGYNPNQSNKYASTLARAVFHGKPEVLDLLIAAGAKEVGSHIAGAAERGDLAIIHRLFAAGVDIEKHGGAALGAAAYHNKVEVVKLLLEKGVPVSADNYHAVGEAARNGSIEVLRVLFAAGVKPKHAGRALRMAALSDFGFAGVKFLVEAGVDPVNHPHYSFDYEGEPVDPPMRPADLLAENPYKQDVADYLRGKPIDVEGRLAKVEALRRRLSNDGLEEALREEKEKKTAHLLRGSTRAEAVQRAVIMARNPAVKRAINQAGKSGQTALVLAAIHGDLEVVSALLEAGADPNQVDRWKNPPLFLAAEAGHTRVVERLLKAGADPNATDSLGNTALIEAADWDEPEMVKLLVDASADPKAEDQGGRTPMNVEHGLRGAEVKALLREAVQQRSGGKVEKGQGLSFVRGESGGAAEGLGVQAFRQFYYNSQPDWVVVFVRGSLEAVASAYAKRTEPVRWEQDVAKKKVASATQYTYLLQLKDSPWTSILWALGRYSVAQMQEAESAARELSRQLATRACTWAGEDKSGAEAFEIFERGKSLKKLETETLFPEGVFENEGIRLPACYPKDDGYEIKLVLEWLQRGDVARADLFVWEE